MPAGRPRTRNARARTGVSDRLRHRGARAPSPTPRSSSSSAARRRVSPFFIPASLINLVSGQVSIRFGFKGPNHSVVTACSTGAHAIGDASRMIALGDADVMVAGGAEAAVCRLGVAGFAAARALSTHFNETPERASRPWDVDRDGFVMGEGAGVVVLEELAHARERGARIYGEIIGYGLSGRCLSHHGAEPRRRRRLPVDGGGAAPRRPAPGRTSTTSTPTAPRRRSATRSSWARSSGCSARRPGACRCRRPNRRSVTCWAPPAASEAIFSLLALHHQVVPPTLNLDRPSEGCDLDLVPYEARAAGGADGAVQFIRLWRHQRHLDLRPRAGTLILRRTWASEP